MIQLISNLSYSDDTMEKSCLATVVEAALAGDLGDGLTCLKDCGPVLLDQISPGSKLEKSLRAVALRCSGDQTKYTLPVFILSYLVYVNHMLTEKLVTSFLGIRGTTAFVPELLLKQFSDFLQLGDVDLPSETSSLVYHIQTKHTIRMSLLEALLAIPGLSPDQQLSVGVVVNLLEEYDAGNEFIDAVSDAFHPAVFPGIEIAYERTSHKTIPTAFIHSANKIKQKQTISSSGILNEIPHSIMLTMSVGGCPMLSWVMRESIEPTGFATPSEIIQLFEPTHVVTNTTNPVAKKDKIQSKHEKSQRSANIDEQLKSDNKEKKINPIDVSGLVGNSPRKSPPDVKKTSAKTAISNHERIESTDTRNTVTPPVGCRSRLVQISTSVSGSPPRKSSPPQVCKRADITDSDEVTNRSKSVTRDIRRVSAESARTRALKKKTQITTQQPLSTKKAKPQKRSTDGALKLPSSSPARSQKSDKVNNMRLIREPERGDNLLQHMLSMEQQRLKNRVSTIRQQAHQAASTYDVTVKSITRYYSECRQKRVLEEPQEQTSPTVINARPYTHEEGNHEGSNGLILPPINTSTGIEELLAGGQVPDGVGSELPRLPLPQQLLLNYKLSEHEQKSSVKSKQTPLTPLKGVRPLPDPVDPAVAVARYKQILSSRLAESPKPPQVEQPSETAVQWVASSRAASTNQLDEFIAKQACKRML